MVTITQFKFTVSTNKSTIMILINNGWVDTSPNPWEFFTELGHPIDELWSIFFLNEVYPTSFVIASQFPNPLEKKSFIFCQYSPNTKTSLVFFFHYCFPSQSVNFCVINTPTL